MEKQSVSQKIWDWVILPWCIFKASLYSKEMAEHQLEFMPRYFKHHKSKPYQILMRFIKQIANS